MDVIFCCHLTEAAPYLSELYLFFQIVQDIPPPIPLDVPMVLIKPREACPTAAVYKVCIFWFKVCTV